MGGEEKFKCIPPGICANVGGSERGDIDCT
jgi:hypothetical protein